MTARASIPGAPRRAAPVAGSLDSAARAYQLLRDATGVHADILRAAGVTSTSTPEAAIRSVKATVGADAWERAAAEGTPLARTMVLLDAMGPTARTAEPAPRRERAAAPPPEDAPYARDYALEALLEQERHERHEKRERHEEHEARAPGSTSASAGTFSARELARLERHPVVLAMMGRPGNVRDVATLAGGFAASCPDDARAYLDGAPDGERRSGSTASAQGPANVPRLDAQGNPRAADVERAKRDPVVLRMFHNPRNRFALDVIAAEHVRTCVMMGTPIGGGA